VEVRWAGKETRPSWESRKWSKESGREESGVRRVLGVGMKVDEKCRAPPSKRFCRPGLRSWGGDSGELGEAHGRAGAAPSRTEGGRCGGILWWAVGNGVGAIILIREVYEVLVEGRPNDATALDLASFFGQHGTRRG
jgi:hypothetical protein